MPRRQPIEFGSLFPPALPAGGDYFAAPLSPPSFIEAQKTGGPALRQATRLKTSPCFQQRRRRVLSPPRLTACPPAAPQRGRQAYCSSS